MLLPVLIFLDKKVLSELKKSAWKTKQNFTTVLLVTDKNSKQLILLNLCATFIQEQFFAK